MRNDSSPFSPFQMAQLTRKIELAAPVLDSAQITADEVLSLVDSVVTPAEEITLSLNEAESFFGTTANVLRPLEYVAYIGTVIKSTRMRLIATQAQNAFKKGTSAMDKASVTIDAAVSPIELYSQAMMNARDALVSSPFFMSGAVTYVTR